MACSTVWPSEAERSSTSRRRSEPDPDPVEDLGRGHLGPEPGDPEEEVLERVTLLGLDLVEELLGPVDLLQEPIAGARTATAAPSAP